MLDENVTAELSKQVLPPMIGIGSGQLRWTDSCDHRLAGLVKWNCSSFVRPYANLNGVDNALRNMF